MTTTSASLADLRLSLLLAARAGRGLSPAIGLALIAGLALVTFWALQVSIR